MQESDGENALPVVEPAFQGVDSGSSGWGKRVVVGALAAFLVLVVLVVVTVGLLRSTAAQPYGGIPTPDAGQRALIEDVRARAVAGGAASRVIVWLDMALERGTDGASVLNYLVSAEEALASASDLQLVEAAQDLRAIINTLRPSSFGATSAVPTAALP